MNTKRGRLIAQLEAPAKLTVDLRVTGVRPDGYHLIDAEMVSLNLFDSISLYEADDITVTMISAANAQSAHDPAAALPIPTDDDNLVAKALRLAGRTAHAVITKRIPSQAGLGGGSADAGAVLGWAGYADVEAAASIGADVPFCMVGGRARVTGIGEHVHPLPFVPATFTLLTPPVGCPTPAVYRRWDELGGPRGPNGNDLEAAAIDLVPELITWRDKLANRTGMTPRLAGSGSTWFVPGEFPGAGHVVAHALDSPQFTGIPQQG